MPSGIIVVSGQEAGSNASILQNTRLQSIPAAGVLTFEIQGSDNDATNNYTADVQLPGNDTPMTAVRIPCGNSTGLAGVLDERTELKASFPVSQGGLCVFGVTETGDAELTWRVTYTPVANPV